MCAWISNEQIINKTGETYVYEKTSQFGDQKRFFCKNCGTTLFWTLGIWPDVTGIAGGCFVDPLPEPTVHVVQGGYVHPWIKLPEHWDTKNEIDGVGVNKIDIGEGSGTLSPLSGFKIGFITNALNPKTTIFFLSIFTQVVEPSTPVVIQIIYGAIISLAHLIWFSCVTCFLTHSRLLQAFKNSKEVIEKVVGVVLMSFGLKLAASGS